MARAIYAELEKLPSWKLNSLRASRLAADAAAIVISVKTGGAGDIVHDIVVAPVLMTLLEGISRELTSNYVENRKAEFKQQLLVDSQKFVNEVYLTPLMRLSKEAAENVGFVNLDPQVIYRFPERVNALADMLSSGREA